MRTGQHRKFTVDLDVQRIEEDLQEGRGLVGGDLERIPEGRRGLRPHLDLDTPVEIRRFPETEAENTDNEAFLQHRPIEIEIGFGGGDFIFQRAISQPDIHFLGFEIRRVFCTSLARRIHKAKLSNLRIIYEDVRQSLPDLLPDHSIRRCSIFFPDPWWKRRHIKRRILIPSFLDLILRKLQPNGILQIKTDVMPYAEQIRELFALDSRFIKDDGSLTEVLADEPHTERETFCLAHGIDYAEFRFIAKPNP
jgi:tRNA (guanine-N7-)-methyltransferase